MAGIAFERVITALPATLWTPPFPYKRSLQRALIRAGAEATVPAMTEGQLPGGLFRSNWQTLVGQFGGTPERAAMLNDARQGLRELHSLSGVSDAIIGGSFVTAKPVPGDIDVLVMPTRHWGRVKWHKLELHYDHGLDVHHAGMAVRAPSSGPGDARAAQSYVEFFSRSRDGSPRGMLLLDLSTVPAPV